MQNKPPDDGRPVFPKIVPGAQSCPVSEKICSSGPSGAASQNPDRANVQQSAPGSSILSSFLGDDAAPSSHPELRVLFFGERLNPGPANIADWRRGETSQGPAKIRPKIPAKGSYRSEEQYFHDFFMRNDLDFRSALSP